MVLHVQLISLLLLLPLHLLDAVFAPKLVAFASVSEVGGGVRGVVGGLLITLSQTLVYLILHTEALGLELLLNILLLLLPVTDMLVVGVLLQEMGLYHLLLLLLFGADCWLRDVAVTG